MTKKSKIQEGLTLIELMVAVSVFTTVLAISSGVFISAIRLQRKALSTQKLLDEVSYATEYMARALRMAKKDTGPTCLSQAGLNYETTATGIKFLNYKDPPECQEFYLDGNILKESKNGGAGVALTSGDFRVTAFSVVLSGESQGDDLQPRVTFSLEVEGTGLEPPRIQLQTTISQRNPDLPL